jgi:hypothetical protein
MIAGLLTRLIIANEPNGEALLSRYIPGQAASLHGVLARVPDLNPPLISVTSVDQEHLKGSGGRRVRGRVL